MKKIFLPAIFSMACFIFTAYYTDPVKTAPNFIPDSLYFAVDSLSSEDSIKTKAELDEGKKLYKAKCKNCHALYSPKDFKLKKWKENLNEMKYKANLSKNEYELILRYLSANCKK